MISDDIKEQIKLSNDIVDVISTYVPLKRAGVSYKACCPFHQEKTASFTVNADKQVYYCFGCQRGGDVIKFVIEYESVDFMGALRLLAERARIDLPEPGKGSRGRGRRDANRRDQFHDLLTKLAVWYRTQLKAPNAAHARDYLSRRCIPAQMQAQFELGYAPDSWRDTLNWGRQQGFSLELLSDAGVLTRKEPDSPITKSYDRFRDRLMFPIWNEQGRVVGFSGRVLTPDASGGKYINSPETPVFHKSRLLYGLHMARSGIRDAGSAVLCEGQLDVISCHEAGITNAVAPQGTAFTLEQARLIKRYTDTLVMAFDADSAGINAALKSIDAFLPAGLTAKVVMLQPGEDPDSLVHGAGPDVLRARLEAAQDYFIFLLEHEIAQTDAETPSGKAQIADVFLRAVSRVESGVSRAEYCQILAERLAIPSAAVFDDLKRIARRVDEAPRPNRSAQHRSARPSPAPSRVSSRRAIPVSPVASDEGTLLEIALNHTHFAHRLLDDLPLDHVSDGPVGQALNEVLARTLEGEWSTAEAALRDRLDHIESTELMRILCAPQSDYGPNAAPEVLSKAYNDCLQTLARGARDAQIADVTAEMLATTDSTRKAQLQRRLMELRRETIAFNKPAAK